MQLSDDSDDSAAAASGPAQVVTPAVPGPQDYGDPGESFETGIRPPSGESTPASYSGP